MTPLTKSLYHDLFIQEQHEICMHFDDIFMYGLSSHPCKEEIESFDQGRLRQSDHQPWTSRFDKFLSYSPNIFWGVMIHQETAHGPQPGTPCICNSCSELNYPPNYYESDYYSVFKTSRGIPFKKMKRQEPTVYKTARQIIA